MKVLLTHERFLPDFGGGGEPIVAQTALHLQKRGLDVQVLTTGDPNITSYQGIGTVRMPVSRYRMNLKAGRVRAMARDADLIHAFNYHACLPSWLAGRSLRKPVVCTCLGLFGDAWLEMRGRVAGRLYRAWERFLLLRPYSGILFLSEFSRRQAMSLGVSEGKTRVSAPGLTGAAANRPAADKDDVVLFAGKFERRKGVLQVLEVARALPGVRFRMLGWGPEKEFLERNAPSNLEIAWETGEEYCASFARASIFFFPSKAETFGMVLLEAMASGCAIVSSVPFDFAGIRVAPADTASMIEAIRRLRENPRLCRELGCRNVELSELYSWENYTEAVLDTYSSVLAPRPRAAFARGVAQCR